MGQDDQMHEGLHVVAAPDKFKGTATAPELTAAIARAVSELGGTCREVPMADGGDGTLVALGGPNRTTTVTGPLGDPVDAEWRLDQGTAVIEMARTSGLVLAGGPDGNDPLAATTAGVGELINAAIDGGADQIIVGVGGSATTDGGLGAVDVIGSAAKLKGVDLVVACDVRTAFVDAASVFGPQKGASPAQVSMLTNRLRTLIDAYRERFGVDVSALPRAGAAGGLAGGLAALGARLVDGFEIVAETAGLSAAIADAQLVITGEGFIDEESFDGKVVGGVVEMAAAHNVPVLAVAGQIFDGAEARIDAISLTAAFGLDRALADPVSGVYEAVRERLQTGL